MKFLSVCSGIEAASVAWEPLAWEPVAFSEIDAFPSAVLAHHYPAVSNWGDMTRYQEWPDATIDILVGGTPCQSFSIAGLRKGMADPRGNLALVYLGIVDRYRPEWMVWENVPGVLSSNGGRDFGTFLGALGKLGYGFAYRVLDAQFFGVPQRRRRVFVIGHLGDWRRAAAVLFERQSLSGDSAPSPQPTREGIACCLRGRANASHRVTAREGKGPNSHCDASEDGTGRGTPLVPVAFAENGRAELRLENGDGSRTGVLSTGGGKVGQGVPAIAFHSRQDPIAGDVAQPVEAGGNGGGVLHDMAVRRLTPRECERLQGFPDDYTQIPYRNRPAEQCPDGPRYRALGNSMAVPVMRWIGERIRLVGAIA